MNFKKPCGKFHKAFLWQFPSRGNFHGHGSLGLTTSYVFLIAPSYTTTTSIAHKGTPKSNFVSHILPNNVWIVDIDALDHMTSFISMFAFFARCIVDLNVIGAWFQNDQLAAVQLH